LHDHIVGSAVEILQGGVGHYTFLTEGSDLGKKAAPELFLDEPGLDRRAIHDHVSEQLSAFFRVHRRAA
jgi:hypothetical protein